MLLCSNELFVVKKEKGALSAAASAPRRAVGDEDDAITLLNNIQGRHVVIALSATVCFVS